MRVTPQPTAYAELTEGTGQRETWYEMAAWIFFALLCASVLPIAVLGYVDPSTTIDLWAGFGHDLPPAAAAYPAAMSYVEFIGHWTATGTFGLDLFGLLIAVTAFRRGERWAWFAFWFWPVMFATHFVTYESSFQYAQLVWLTLSVAALLAVRRKALTTP